MNQSSYRLPTSERFAAILSAACLERSLARRSCSAGVNTAVCLSTSLRSNDSVVEPRRSRSDCITRLKDHQNVVGMLYSYMKEEERGESERYDARNK